MNQSNITETLLRPRLLRNSSLECLGKQPNRVGEIMKEGQQKESNRRFPTAVWITYVNIVLYALCFQLQRPIEPFLVQKFASSDKDSAHMYGKLQSYFSIIQMIGSPLIGFLLDRVGIRFASAMVFASSALSYAILAMASNWNYLLYSKVPTAFQHAFLVAQATATASTTDQDIRMRALARMTTAYTIGATVGPLVGGELAMLGDLYLGARLAVMGSLLSVVLSVCFLPSQTRQPAEQAQLCGRPPFTRDLQISISIARRSHLWPLLLVKVLSGISASMYSTTLPIILTQKLYFEPTDLGLNMSASMFAVATFGAIGIGPLSRFIGGASIMARFGLVMRIIAGCFMVWLVTAPPSTTSAMFQQVINHYFTSRNNNQGFLQLQIASVSVLDSIASHALATGLTTQTTGLVNANEQGSLLGLEHGLFSLARVYGPSLGIRLLQDGFPRVVQMCVGLDTVLLLILIWTASRSRGNHSKLS